MNFSILHMTVEYLEKAVQVDTPKPRFGWWLESEENGLLQKAYQILVKEGDRVTWNSQKILSDSQFHIEYQGSPLKPETTYTWTLTVWNQSDESVSRTGTFETAMLTDSIEGFEGARWIGNHTTLPLYANALSVFQIRSEFTIRQGFEKGGFLYGGDDPRLMNSYLNILGVENSEGESYLKIELDISGIPHGLPARINAYRIGYMITDQIDVPLYSLEISDQLINADNCHKSHELILYSEFGQTDLFLDGTDHNHQLIGPVTDDFFQNMNRRWNMNPSGRGGDYIAYPVLGKIGLYEPVPGSVTFHTFEVRNFRKPENILYQGIPEQCNHLYDVSTGGNTMLRTCFAVKSEVKRARIYATARGIYNLYVNGSRVGNDYFAPGLSQYDHHQFYQVLDITEQIRSCTSKEQCLGILLGEGWFSGAISYTGKNWNFFGDRNSVLLKMVLEYEDGSKDVFVSDPEKYEMSQDGPVIAASIFQGTVYDCEKEWILNDFSKADFDSSDWMPAQEVPCDETTSCFEESGFSPVGGQMPTLNYSNLKFAAQPDPGVKVCDILTAVSVTEPVKGVYIYDMGQNIAGIPRITVTGHAGQNVTLRFAEVLYPDMDEYAGKAGTLMLENIRAAHATDFFLLREGKQTLCPLFTYHGYRYVEITGIEKAPDPCYVQGLALSSLSEVTASFKCSNHALNRLYENISWSLRDNYISIPSDCPQRNERMGWSGDLSVFSRSAVYMSLSEPFLTRHLAALRDTQQNGRFSDITPVGGGFGGTLWGSAGITVPWEMYLQYGDLRALEEMYDSMYAYIRFLESKKDEHGIVKEGPLGDWLGPENSRNESAFLWQCYYIFDLEIVLKSAKILGKTEHVSRLESEYEHAKKVFREFYLDSETCITTYSDRASAMSMNSPFDSSEKETEPDRTASGKYMIDTQTSYAVSYALTDLDTKEKEKLGAHLNSTCSRTNINDLNQLCPPYTLMTGFIGTSWISQSLSDAGFHETAWRMLKSGDYPSWLYPVKNGATTIWERLNSYTKEDGFGGNNSMNSFNHYSFGAVAAWMLGYAGGIRRGNEPGTFRICPIPDPDADITWADVSVQTVSGTYRVLWKLEGEHIIYRFHIPGGRSTDVELLCTPAQSISLQKNLEAISTVSDLHYDGNALTFKALPGTYNLI